MKESTQKQTDQLKKQFASAVTLVTKRRFILIFVILGAAISFALYRTQSYIDIPRNETRFNEGILTINYKEIDGETLQSFKEKLDDQSIEVDAQFDPTRENPFID